MWVNRSTGYLRVVTHPQTTLSGELVQGEIALASLPQHNGLVVDPRRVGFRKVTITAFAITWEAPDGICRHPELPVVTG